jgi:histidinol-phosphate/aromatic aminotransferase/cobyric acid decarboxylase-like protein
MRLDESGPDAAEVVRRAAGRGVHLRDCRELFAGTSRRWLRTAVKDRAANERIVEAIAAALSG